MLLNVETLNLFLFGNTKTDSLLNNCKCNDDGYYCPSDGYEHTAELFSELCKSAAVEETFGDLCSCKSGSGLGCKETYCDGTPDTVEHVNCYGTDGIVYMSYVIVEPYTEYYEKSCNGADDGCACAIGYVARSGDCYKTCK